MLGSFSSVARVRAFFHQLPAAARARRVAFDTEPSLDPPEVPGEAGSAPLPR